MDALSADPFVVSGVSLATAVAALLAAERRESRRGIRLWKPIASTVFVAAAVCLGALESHFGRLILLALSLSWLGDVFLISSKSTAFLAGLASFLLAHLAFAGAFALKPVDATLLALAAIAMTAVAAVILRWLWPNLPRKMRIPVIAYALAIATMMALAVGTVPAQGGSLVIPAGLFVLSDVFVARERFVSPIFFNRLVGLPLYYAAQLLFAWQLH